MLTKDCEKFTSSGGVEIIRRHIPLEYRDATAGIIDDLDSYKGILLSSSFEFPGRYTRWDVGFVKPPLQINASGRNVEILALNQRGEMLLLVMRDILRSCDAVESLSEEAGSLGIRIRKPEPVRFEEERSRQHSVFSLLRSVRDYLHIDEPYLGLYGAFGYELAFQFEPVETRLSRVPGARDLVLFLPDAVTVVDHQKELACRYLYDFIGTGYSTFSLPREGSSEPFEFSARPPQRACDHDPGEYAATVRTALEYFRRGDLFETVPGQMFFEQCRDKPSAVYRRLKQGNPAPYGAFFNLGEQEYLISASPEMYVRVRGSRVETCPISGTIARGANALEDAEQIRTLLNSVKDLAELSMCTDVDRNDKARVCKADSIRVIGRRQVELYSRLIHTVDHVEGVLKPGFDALDAFLSHTWAVTVTGAPKPAAIQFIEDHEKSPRRWYGGAMGSIGFNGNLNTGLVLRTTRIHNGIAEVRAGATLLFDSDPDSEAAETELKASALLAAIRGDSGQPGVSPFRDSGSKLPSRVLRVLMVDHRDSFVHTLSAYFQNAGADVKTVRFNRFAAELPEYRPDLVVLSPGPGLPDDFNMGSSIDLVLKAGIPLFGVCLGLQGIVEYFGGTLAQLDYPVHGKSSLVLHQNGPLFRGIGEGIAVARYHSLIAGQMPDCLKVTARTQDAVVMAVEHETLPIWATQFHPESILSMQQDTGSKLIANLLGRVDDRLQVRQMTA